MTDKKDNNNDGSGRKSNEFDDVDEDLLALSPPPPNPKFLIFILTILAMSFVMMVWFYPELRYFLAAFKDTVQLGEAADLDVRKLETDRLAEVDGFPMVQRTLTFKEGVKWFMMSDNLRKFFPLAGQPHLYVQWAETAEHKAYRDPETQPGVLGPPSHFRGHLRSRESMGKNYDRIWVFYDCLKYHYLGRCNYCLGRSTLDDCRRTFVCAESNGDEACKDILSRSEESVKEELSAAEKTGDAEAKERLAQQMLVLEENAILTRSVELEELGMRVGRMQDRAVREKSSYVPALEKSRAKILAMRVDELEIRAQDALRTAATLSEAEKQEIRSLHKELDTLTTDEAALVSTLKTMKVLVQMGDGIHRWKKRTEAVIEKAQLLRLPLIEKLSNFDPSSQKGQDLFDSLSRLESEIADAERTARSAANAEEPVVLDKTAENKDAAADTDTPKDTEQVNEDASKAALARPLPDLNGNPIYEGLKAKLSALKDRFRTLEIRLGNVLPGRLPELEKWAKKPDVLGEVPDALMEPRVLSGISEIERMTAALTPATDAPPEPDFALARTMNDNIDKLAAMRDRMKKIPQTPGFYELKIVDALASLKSSLKESMPQPRASAASAAVDGLIADMITHNLYLSNLKGAPEAMQKLESLITEKKISALAEEIAAPAAVLESSDFVLVDGEIPLDRLWVAFVYIVLIVMVIVNIRKVIRFVDAYRK